MIKRCSLIFLAGLMVTSLSSCAVVGGLIQSILRVPGSILRSVTEGETPEKGEGEPTPGILEEEEAPGVLVVAPME